MAFEEDPQNPYASCVVRASAGSGKTYQLSRRFLFLVGAGAAPASILTVTFTKKAAGEMRERILDTAAQLLSDRKAQLDFDRRLEAYYHQSEHRLHRPRPPRSAQATAEAILASTQSLRIATIDAVLLEWMKKFPYEAGARGSLLIPAPFELMNQQDEERVHRRSWYLAVEALKADARLRERWKVLRSKGMHLLDLELRIKELGKHESFLWLLQKQKDFDSERKTFLAHPLPDAPWDGTPEAFLKSIAPDLGALCGMLRAERQSLALEAIAAGSLDALIEQRVLTKSWEVHNGSFRSPKRDPYEAHIRRINEQAQLLRSYASRSALNELGQFLIHLYEIYESEQQKAKLEMGRLGFSDLVKGGYHLFSRPEAAGIRFLLHRTIRHLLLDEFQDTSILQWSMFNSMASEMLAGEGLRGRDELASSLFIVGDAKQSIYGFREAEAEVLEEAAAFMLSREALDINLSASYRTAPGLLAYINQVFTGSMAGFPQHTTAEKARGVSFVPGSYSLTIGPLFQDSEGGSAINEEARFVASRLRMLIEDPATPPLWDKQLGHYRRLEARDCVILYRAATQAGAYAEALRSEGLPARLEEGRSFFERPEVRDIMAFCRWMSLPSHTEAFIHFLKSPLFRLQDSALLDALRRVSPHERSRYERHLAILDALAGRYPASIKRIKTLLAQRSILKPQALLRWAADQGGWSQAYRSCFGAEEGVLAAANLHRFLETVSDLEAQSYYDWLPLVQKLDELAAEQAISLASVSENAVQLMTIHKAKGLEFPLVALVGTGEEWEKTDPYWAKIKASRQGSGMAYMGRRMDRSAPDPHFEELEQLLRDGSRQENLRLLYVALTRAQYHLLITGYQRARYPLGFYPLLQEAAVQKGAKAQDWKGWSLLQLADASVGTAQQSEAAIEKAHPFQALSAWQAPLPPFGAIKILAPARLLENAESHNFTASGGTPHPYAASIGTFVHRGLEAWAKNCDFFAAAVWQSLSDGQPAFAETFDLAQRKLARVLESAAFRDLLLPTRQRLTEWPIAFLQGTHLVRGTIDLLVEIEPQHWLVVDYKTSEEALSYKDLRALSSSKRYDQQLDLYVQGVRLLFPEARVDGAIFFTERLEFVTYAGVAPLRDADSIHVSQ